MVKSREYGVFYVFLIMHFLASAAAVIKQSYALKLNHCVVRRNALVTKFVKTLYELGFIKGFTSLDKVFIVHMQYTRTKLGLRRIALFSKMTNKVFLKRGQTQGRTLHGFYRSNGVILYLTSYTAGFLTQWECGSLGIGGEPILVIG